MAEQTAIKGYTMEDVVKAVIGVLEGIGTLEEPAEPKEVLVPESTVKEFRGFENYPPVLQARHVREILGVCEATAYEILNSKACPTIRRGKRMVVLKDSFLQFLKDSEGKEIE